MPPSLLAWFALAIVAAAAAVLAIPRVSRRHPPGREPGAAGTAAAPLAPGGAAVPAEESMSGPFAYDNGVKYDGGGEPR